MTRRQRLYLDTCCFSRPYDDMTDPIVYDEAQAILQIQEGISEGRFSLAWSYVLDIEVFNNPFLQRRYEVLLWGDIASYLVRRRTPEITSLSNVLQSRGLKFYDSLHVASAVDLYCDYFITTDRKILSAPISEIQVVGPVDFIHAWKEGKCSNVIRERSTGKDVNVARNYTEWRRTHLPEYSSVDELSRHAEEFSMKLRRLGTDAVKEIASGRYETFEEIEAAIDARLKPSATAL